MKYTILPLVDGKPWLNVDTAVHYATTFAKRFQWGVFSTSERGLHTLVPNSVCDGRLDAENFMNALIEAEDEPEENLEAANALYDRLMSDTPPAPSSGHILSQHYGEWGEYPPYSVEDWMREVAAGNTRKGYWDWVSAIGADERTRAIQTPNRR